MLSTGIHVAKTAVDLIHKQAAATQATQVSGDGDTDVTTDATSATLTADDVKTALLKLWRASRAALQFKADMANTAASTN